VGASRTRSRSLGIRSSNRCAWMEEDEDGEDVQRAATNANEM